METSFEILEVISVFAVEETILLKTDHAIFIGVTSFKLFFGFLLNLVHVDHRLGRLINCVSCIVQVLKKFEQLRVCLTEEMNGAICSLEINAVSFAVH